MAGSPRRELQQFGRQEVNHADPVHHNHGLHGPWNGDRAATARHAANAICRAQRRPAQDPGNDMPIEPVRIQIEPTQTPTTTRPIRHHARRRPPPPAQARTPPCTTCSRSRRVATALREAPRRHRPRSLRRLRQLTTLVAATRGEGRKEPGTPATRGFPRVAKGDAGDGNLGSRPTNLLSDVAHSCSCALIKL